MPWGISVFGASSVSSAPDVARVRMSVRQTLDEPSEVFAATRMGVARVREALRGHGIPDGAVSVSRLNMQTQWHFENNRRKFAGYECVAAFEVELRDLDILEAVLVDAVAAGVNEVGGVEFDVSAKKDLRARARKAAVAAATEKAELYAEAAGIRLGRVLHIKDVDSDQLANTYRSHGSDARYGSEGDLTPGRVTVTAGVLIGFSILES